MDQVTGNNGTNAYARSADAQSAKRLDDPDGIAWRRLMLETIKVGEPKAQRLRTRPRTSREAD